MENKQVFRRIPNILRITVRFRTSPPVTCVNRICSKYNVTYYKARFVIVKINVKWADIHVIHGHVFWGQWKGDKGQGVSLFGTPCICHGLIRCQCTNTKCLPRFYRAMHVVQSVVLLSQVVRWRRSHLRQRKK